MKYLLQFEFEKDKKAKFWLPLLIVVDAEEEAINVSKSIRKRLIHSFGKVLSYDVAEFKDELGVLNIVKDYIEDEKTGTYFKLRAKEEDLLIEEVDENTEKEVSFQEDFMAIIHNKEKLSYLDFKKNSILTREISDNINNFDEYLIVKFNKIAGILKMNPKKNPKADLEQKRLTIFLSGLSISLLIVLVFINIGFSDAEASSLAGMFTEDEEEEIIPLTEQNTPPPPPPPPAATVELEIVEDEVEVEDVDVEIEEAEDETIIDFEEEEEVVEEEIFTVVETMPSFPGGEKALFGFLKKNIKYPAMEVENGIQGKVYVNFVVGKDGKIRDVKILRGVSKALDAEAVRVVKSFPSWSPGKQRGKTVTVRYMLPINFSIQ